MGAQFFQCLTVNWNLQQIFWLQDYLNRGKLHVHEVQPGVRDWPSEECNTDALVLFWYLLWCHCLLSRTFHHFYLKLFIRVYMGVDATLDIKRHKNLPGLIHMGLQDLLFLTADELHGDRKWCHCVTLHYMNCRVNFLCRLKWTYINFVFLNRTFDHCHVTGW